MYIYLLLTTDKSIDRKTKTRFVLYIYCAAFFLFLHIKSMVVSDKKTTCMYSAVMFFYRNKTVLFPIYRVGYIR